MNTWIVISNGLQRGPFSASELRSMAASGEIQASDVIFDQTSGRRMVASAVAGLVFPRIGANRPAAGMPPLPLRPPGAADPRHGESSRGVPRSNAAAPPPRRPSAANNPLTIGPPGIEATESAYSVDGSEDPLAAFAHVPPPVEWNGGQEAGVAGTGRPPGNVGGQLSRISPAQAPSNPTLPWALVGGAAAVVLAVALIVGVMVIRRSSGTAAILDPHIRLVQTGRLEGCPHRSVREMTDSFLTKPQWRSLVGPDDLRYVNCRGGLVYGGHPATAELQFQIIGDGFSLHSLEIDGEPQSLLTRAVLIRKMCEE
jgi:hypothetical protein